MPRVVEVKEESKATAQLKKPSRDKADVSDPGEGPLPAPASPLKVWALAGCLLAAACGWHTDTPTERPVRSPPPPPPLLLQARCRPPWLAR